MTDKEVVGFRDDLERIYSEEKLKAYGQEHFDRITDICHMQSHLAEAFDNKPKENKEKFAPFYRMEQMGLENEKLTLMGALI